jgi:hypothetical protein
MPYDLRGYHRLSTGELIAQFRNNQERNGHVNGFANWGAYTPGMMYAVAQNFLLSRHCAALDRLLPYSQKALDSCLAQTLCGPSARLYKKIGGGSAERRNGSRLVGLQPGILLRGPGFVWPGTRGDRQPAIRREPGAARMLREATERGFQPASTRSPIVQLRDRTWQPYVPSEARTYQRMLDQWYPADVDTGALHPVRLKAIPADGELATWLLNDHEGNLYLGGRGIANEPVYNQQAAAYLLSDDPKAAIRTFYRYMASAFSHSVFEPVEHRWTHGQYFGPPSTDGAWFEPYRNLLIHERDDGSLVLGMATPRAWLADSRKIEVERAPTYYGAISMTYLSEAKAGRISAEVDMPGRSQP